jgi:hypothetical protein
MSNIERVDSVPSLFEPMDRWSDVYLLTNETQNVYVLKCIISTSFVQNAQSLYSTGKGKRKPS